MYFSLIIPVFRIRDYISSCLESCCQQNGISPEDYEIIIVNDETPDDSIEKAQNIIKKYPNHHIRIINRKNGGLSAARNSGLAEAKGDYLWFIDGDDYIETSSLASLQTIIKENNFDIINFRHRVIFQDKHIEHNEKNDFNHQCSGIQYLSVTSFLSVWINIYNRLFIERHKLRFKEGVIWEDSEFNIRAFSLARNCYCIESVLYNYIRRGGSISDERATDLSTQSRISNVKSLDSYFTSIPLSFYDKKVVYKHITSILIFAIAGLPEIDSKSREKYRKEILSNRKLLFHLVCSSVSLTYFLILLSFLITPHLAEKLLNRRVRSTINKASTKSPSSSNSLS